MKQILALLLVALLAAVFVSAQEAEADLAKFRCKALIPACGYKLPKLSPLSDEELADKKWWQPVLSVLGQIGKGAIKDYVNKNWDEIPEEESDLKLNELFVQILPYLKAGVKDAVNQNLADANILDLILPYIKAGVRDYVNTNWDNMTESDKGFWGKVWKVVKEVGKGAVKNYVNTNWDEQTEQSDKFWKKLLNVVKQVGKGAIKSYVNQNFDAEADLKLAVNATSVPKVNKSLKRLRKFYKLYKLAKKLRKVPTVQSDKFFKKIGKLFKKALPYLKAGVKEYVNNNFDEQSDKFFKKLGKLLKKAVPYLKAGVKEYVNNNFDEEADFKFGKLLKKVGKIGLKLGKAYLRTQGIPLNDEQADKFWKKLWGVVKQVGKGAIKSYVNQNFDAQADFKLGKLLKKVGKVGLKLGKAYLRTQGIPLEDEVAVRRVRRVRRIRAPRFRRERVIRRRRAVVEADNFLLDILKGAAKEYVNRNWDNEVESDKFFKKLGKLFKKALPYLKAGVKDYVNNNFDEAADLRLPNPWWTAAKILFTPRPAY